MLTPRFKIHQDDKYVVISLYAPFTHVADTEIFMEGTDFRFYSKPYFLRLHLTGEIEENDHASAKFDAESLSYIVKCPKVHLGEYFPKLDMITELCKPEGATEISNIEELCGDTDEESWYFEQNIPLEEEVAKTNKILEDCCIGFGLTHTGVFDKLLLECQEILDIKDPEKLSLSCRRSKRLEKESNDFDSSHYLCDLYEPDNSFRDILNFQVLKVSPELDSDEILALTNYTKKNINTIISEKSTMYGLVDILYSYCFDFRMSLGEHSSESGWLISKLSASLVCSEIFSALKDCVKVCFRRSLIYPMIRHYDICMKVLKDLLVLLENGKMPIIKALLRITKIFNESEGRYLFNQLYIDQYVAWIQKIDMKILDETINELSSIINEISKEDLDLELKELESAAHMVHEEKLISEMQSTLRISNRSANESDSDDDEEEDSTEESSEEETDSDE